MVLIGVPQIAMNELNNVHKEFDVAWKTRKASHMCLAKHMMMIRDRYMERILNTRFEVTRTKLNSGSFDMEIELDLYDMEIAAPFSFNEDIYEKIGTNECNTIGKSGEDIIEEEQKSSLDPPHCCLDQDRVAATRTRDPSETRTSGPTFKFEN